MPLRIEYLEETMDVYDIGVEKNENFYANGILVHNCQEIGLPTVPMRSADDAEAEIALCTLAAINWGRIRGDLDFKRPAQVLVRTLDALLDYQSYPMPAAENATLNRRPLGIGIINLAYWMAKNGYTYQNASRECLEHLHVNMEAMSYELISASVDLAVEKGACRDVAHTRYFSGRVPIDTYKKEVDELVEPRYFQDWDGLRSRLIAHGIRNSTLMAQMPAETSAQVSNGTNGVEPVRALVSIKQSKDGVLKQVVPEFWKLRKKYDLLWDQKSPDGYLRICAVIQKFMDQCISVNTSYNPQFYPDEKIPMSVMIGDVLNHYRWGGKTLYYQNTYDGAGELPVGTQEEAEDCDACKI